MKKSIAALLVCLFFCFGYTVHAAEPDISAYAAVLYEPVTGTVLFEKNSDEMLPMASTTKIMTALLAFESGLTDVPVKITDEMVRTEGSSMGLTSGDVLTLGELAEGMMMTSGNDSANAIALFMNGSMEAFADRMNKRAREIGMKHTSFVTPSGLDAENHFSTAHDMALLAAEALKCDAFAETVGQFSLMVDFIQPEKSMRCDNHNKLLHLYEDCTGVKTGFTKKAGRCLVSSAEREGMELICVTLNAPDDWNDHISLFEYGFTGMKMFEAENQSVSVPVVGGSSDFVVCTTEETLKISIPQTCEVESYVSIPHFLYAPIEQGEEFGTISYYVNEREIARVSLCADKNIEYAAAESRSLRKWAEHLFCRK